MDQIVRKPAPAASDTDIESALGLDKKGRGKSRRRWVAALVAIAALGAAAYGWQRNSGPAPLSYQTVTAERGDLTIEVSATGTLQPVTQVDVSSELSGILRTVDVVENQRVSAGQVIAALDTARLEAQVERAEAGVKAAAARVTEAQVTLKEAEQTLVRTGSLSERGMVATQALDTAVATRDRAQSAVETAEANLSVAEADLRLQQADLAKSTIVAPIDGIVLTRSADPGQTVASSMSAPVLFVIAAKLEQMELKAAVDEADIGQVAIGQEARFTVDAFPGRQFEAKIRDIAYAAVTTEGVVTYEARLTVDNSDLSLRPGMTATVSVVVRQADDVITVPAAAFRYSPPPPESADRGGFSLERLFMPRFGGRGRGGQPQQANADGSRTLYVLENGEPAARQVMTGASDGDRTEIVSGLEAGDAVVLGQREGRGARRPAR